jgi:bacterioferritin-associated ferredoxin
MTLPVFDVPQFTTILPSYNRKVSFRPFLVKEQKQLLMAVAGSPEEQVMAVNNIIDACTFNKLNARRLPAFDVEYLFLQIRSKSIGENVEVLLTCGNCGERTKNMLDVTKVAVNKPDGHSNTIDLGQDVIVKMDYPRLEDLEIDPEAPSVDRIIQLIASCIQSIWQGEEMFAAEDYSMEELIEFVENLNPENLAKIEEFFKHMPVVQHVFEWDCGKCEHHNRITMEGLQNFFG